MSVINGITVLLIYQLLGEVTVRFVGLPVPGPVMGMAMLFVTLVIRKGAPESLNRTATGLLTHLSLLFVPAGVGMVLHLELLRENGVSIAIALFLSTLISLVVMALFMQTLARRSTDSCGE